MRAKLLLSLCLLIPSIVCAQDQRPVPPQASQRIAKEVVHQILMLPYYTVFDYITGSVKGYDVTLKGWVTNPTLKTTLEMW